MNLVTRCAAPVQYYDAVKRYLDKEYTLVVDRYIGRQDSTEWSALSPDLTPF